MKQPILCVALVSLGLWACGSESDPDLEYGPASGAPMSDANPLLCEWDTPFGVPPFDRIASEDYLPALRAGMAEQVREIDAITANSEPATFANTIEALERTGAALNKVNRVFSALNSAHADQVIRETSKTIAPELSAHRDHIHLNAALFERVREVFEQNNDLDDEQRKLLEETHKQFVRSGADLDEESKARLRDINSELASLDTTFQENLLDETNTFELLVTEEADLGDLPTSLIDLAAEEAKRRGHDCECWAFTLQRASINPFLQYSPNRDLRKTIFEGYAMRGDNDNQSDNKEVVARTVALRAERAALLGYDSHAHYVLSDNMAETPENVYEFLDQIWDPALRVAQQERIALQDMLHEDGIDDQLRGWDWRYYTEKVRKAKYDFDEDELRPFFEVNALRNGVFALATELFGLRFEEREDLPKWHSDQRVFEVSDADGSHIAILYMDYFARETKRGGAWMNSLRPQSKIDGNVVTPIITNNFNFPPPTANSPSLLSLSEAETMLHEFGHALHGMLSDVTYESLSGTRVPRDFVEFPSQVMENWLWEPDVLRLFARHYETGELVPQQIIDKITASAKFNQGFTTVEYLAAAYLDMAYHVLESPARVEPREFEIEAMKNVGLIDEIIPRYRSGYFAHVFSGGYAAGYYAYIWAEVLDADTFRAFKETDLFNRELATRYRNEVLSKGGTRPGMELYSNFLGRSPAIGPLLERRGLN
jgi:peptidyl-dipeptidase Dcp